MIHILESSDFYFNDGKIAGAVCSLTEITRLKVIEQNLSSLVVNQTKDIYQLDTDLKISEKRYQTLFNNAPTSIVLLKDHKVVFTNHAFVSTFGYNTPEEIINAPTLQFQPPELRESLQALEKRRYERLQVPTHYESFGLKKDGSVFPVLVNVAVTDFSDGQLIMSFLTNLTEIKQLQSEKDLLITQLRETNQELEELVYIVAHDLKEPIRKMSNFNQLIKNSIQDRLQGDEELYFDQVLDGTKRLYFMVESLLDYSQISRRSSINQNQQINLKEIIDHLLQFELSQSVQDTKAVISLSVDISTLTGDPSHFYRLFQNLLANAIKYIDDTSIPFIEINGIETQDQIEIRVIDNCIGVDPEEQTKIFKMFYTSPKAQNIKHGLKEKGEGIGLAVCKKIVNQYNGKISVYLNESKGSTFLIGPRFFDNF